MTVPTLHPTSRGSAPAVPATSGVAAVVAPYGTGKYYQAEVTTQGWGCVAVTPAQDLLPPIYRKGFDPRGYSHVVVHDGDLESTAHALRAFGVSAVLAGTEIGVPLAEALASRLGLPGNSPRTSSLRRDKGAMAAALHDAGIDAPHSLATDSLTEALAWASLQPGTEFVLKPADSAGSDGVAFCDSPDQIRSAWHRLHQIPNAMGGSNTTLILQERLPGTQYVVNSVSAPDSSSVARHAFTEFWADHRIGHLYDRLDLLQPSRIIPRKLATYTARVLDVLGITTGPAHTEVMHVPNRGPVLIETGARPEGSYPPDALRAATGSDHIRDAVHAAITGQPDRLSASHPQPFVTKVSLIAPRDGTLDPHLLRFLLTLPTVRGHVGALIGGGPVTRTVDLLTSPGRLVLAADNLTAVNQDYATIRSLEASGLYAGTSPR
ncbi:hypothetical protein [Streptomyces sp. NPDC127038]|uniref:hypothetical protein n=1 Tax=Streptomyces sp. NPDC127038 TaxID=3347114 RepID=UPI00365BADA3